VPDLKMSNSLRLAIITCLNSGFRTTAEEIAASLVSSDARLIVIQQL
jgi:hypothetical protein